MTNSKLHLGCGDVIRDGWLNHDLAPLTGVDVVHDLREFPWPFEDGQFEEVYMKDVLEHLPDTIATMEELHRITKPGAKVYIGGPYRNSMIAFGDPTHVKSFNEFCFDFFDFCFCFYSCIVCRSPRGAAVTRRRRLRYYICM